jgi:hypothetical protein
MEKSKSQANKSSRNTGSSMVKTLSNFRRRKLGGNSTLL